MTKIRNKPITKETGVTLTIADRGVIIGGPKGNVTIPLPRGIIVSEKDSKIEIGVKEKSQEKVVGLYHRLIQNAVAGVTKEWTKELELVGVGYRAQTTGTTLTLNLGFSHPIAIQAPDGISFAVAENKITVVGRDKYVVGEVAAKIRKLKKPEPYKGKGIRYTGEYIRKKAGKAAKAVGGAPGAK